MSEFSTPQSGEGIKSMDKPDELIATHDSSSLLSEDQFLCSICLYVFTDPISTPCGHNYCKTCLTRYWDTSNYYQCPLCKETFIKRPELKINTTLREVVGHFKKSRVDNPEILCDVCTDGKLKALKSCLDCGVTFCMKHLEPHSVGKLKKHKLIEPVENLEDYTCQKHDRPLELYCRDDKTSVCLFCTETDHKTHNTVPIEKETSERKLQLTDTQTEVQHMIQQKLKKIEELKHSVELRKRNTEKEIADSAEVFTALMCSIERSQAELLEVMKEKQKAAERQAEGFIKELEQEITRLKKRDTELETVLQQKDHIQFLQNYQTLCAAPHTKNWTGINVDLDLSADTVKDILSKLQKTLNEELSKTISEKLRKIVSSELKRIQQYAVDVVLDPDTAHPHLILSEDGKQVAYGDDGDEKQTLSENPKRFTYYAMILGQEGFSSGKFFYEVQVKGKTKWELGVAYESINRKGEVTLSPEDGFWALVLRNGNKYKACAISPVPLYLKEKPQRVGVFVDYEQGLVSFYDVEARTHIYSFIGQSFTEKLYPFFSPCNNDKGKNSDPLILTTLPEAEY